MSDSSYITNPVPMRPKLYAKPNAIRSRRLYWAWGRQELATKTDLSVALIAMLETQERPVSTETVSRLADALRCQPYEIAEVRGPEDVAAEAAPAPAELYSEAFPAVNRGKR